VGSRIRPQAYLAQGCAQPVHQEIIARGLGPRAGRTRHRELRRDKVTGPNGDYEGRRAWVVVQGTAGYYVVDVLILVHKTHL